jgi:hypothetical protein
LVYVNSIFTNKLNPRKATYISEKTIWNKQQNIQSMVRDLDLSVTEMWVSTGLYMLGVTLSDLYSWNIHPVDV